MASEFQVGDSVMINNLSDKTGKTRCLGVVTCLPENANGYYQVACEELSGDPKIECTRSPLEVHALDAT